jgi:hypothetical protein
MKYPRIIIENHIQKILIALPHGQQMQISQPAPLQISFFIKAPGCPAEMIYPVDKTKPIFAGSAKTRPTHRPPQGGLFAQETGLLKNLTPETRKDILLSLHLATKTIVFSQMLIVRPPIPVHEQGLQTIRRKNKTECCQYWSVHQAFLMI